MPEFLEVYYAPLEKFVPCKHNKRIWGKKSPENTQLTNLIKESGDVDPLLVCKAGNKFEIISGESRYHSAGKLKLKQLPYKLLDVKDLEEKLIHVIIRNIGHACSQGKLARAITQFLLLTEPKPPVDEMADPRVQDIPEFIEPAESVSARAAKVINTLSFKDEDKEKWITQVTRLFVRAKGNAHAQRVIESAVRIADASGIDGLALSNDKADEQLGVPKTPKAEEEPKPKVVIVPEIPTPSMDTLIKENEKLRVKAQQDAEYGDSQGQTLNIIERELYKFCELAHQEARRQGGDSIPMVVSLKIETLMAGLGLRSYLAPETPISDPVAPEIESESPKIPDESVEIQTPAPQIDSEF